MGIERVQGTYQLGKTGSASGQTRILFCGDFAIARNWLGDDLELSFGPTLSTVLQQKDLSVVNLETPLTACRHAIVKSGPSIRAHRDDIRYLKQGGFDVASLANNHILDFGPDGLTDTIAECESNGLMTVGAGTSREQIPAPLVLERPCGRVGIIAAAEEEFNISPDGTVGAAILEPLSLLTRIRELKEQGILVLVFPHGGNEMYPLPSPRLKRLYRSFIEAGADAVIGHHTHVISGLEFYQERPIIYSLGNMVFPFWRDTEASFETGLVAELAVSPQGVQAVTVHPCKQTPSSDGLQVELCDATDRKLVFELLDAQRHHIADDELLDRLWRCFCESRRDHYSRILKYGASGLVTNLKRDLKTIIKGGHYSLLPSWFSSILQRPFSKINNKTSWQRGLKNVLACPSHYDVLLTLLHPPLEQTRDEQATTILDSLNHHPAFCR